MHAFRPQHPDGRQCGYTCSPHCTRDSRCKKREARKHGRKDTVQYQSPEGSSTRTRAVRLLSLPLMSCGLVVTGLMVTGLVVTGGLQGTSGLLVTLVCHHRPSLLLVHPLGLLRLSVTYEFRDTRFWFWSGRYCKRRVWGHGGPACTSPRVPPLSPSAPPPRGTSTAAQGDWYPAREAQSSLGPRHGAARPSATRPYEVQLIVPHRSDLYLTVYYCC